jgi:hypothetical protein
MRKNTVVLDFLKFTVPNKIVFARTVLSKMSLLPLFATPDVAYRMVQEIVGRLEGYYMSSRGGDHEQIALMHQVEEELDNALRDLGLNVNRVAKGDEAIILSTGFHLVKQPAPSERPEFTVELGDIPASVWLKRKAVTGASSYVWQYFIGPEAPADDKWLFAGSTTQASFLITELPQGTKVWFRVAAVTSGGMQPFTDSINRFIS